MFSTKKQDQEKLKSLKINQLFSVDILIESIVITSGPYKNAGDLNNITESEDSDDDKTSQSEEEFRENQEITVGMAMLDYDSHTPITRVENENEQDNKNTETYIKCRSKSPRIKKTCHTIAIDSWAPGAISSHPYMPDRQSSDTRLTPFQLCKMCMDVNNMNTKSKSKECKCEQEYCYNFPIDSLGPAINSSSGLKQKQCKCLTSKHDRIVADKNHQAKGTSREEKKSSREKQDKGSKKPDKGGKKKKEIPDKGKIKKNTGVTSTANKEELSRSELPKLKQKKRKKWCKKPPKTDGPLPPLRVSISLFHIKDIKINQVDLDKLYPPQDQTTLDEDPNQEQEDIAPGQKGTQEDGLKEKKNKSKKTSMKADTKDKGKNKGKSTSSKSSAKSSGSSKQDKEETSKSTSKISAISKQSKNVIKLKTEAQGIDKNQLGSTLYNLKMLQAMQEINIGNHQESMSKYKELGMLDGVKCSEDLLQKQKQNRKQKHLENEQRNAILNSLRTVTDFKRGISFVFSSTPFDIIWWLLIEKMEIVVDRCSTEGPVYPIGKVKIKLPSIYRDRVQASSRSTTRKSLWTCLENTYPVIDCKGKQVGNISLYLCLTSLGQAMASTTLLSETSLYEYTDTAYYIGQKNTSLEVEPRPTAFNMSYGNLQQVTLKDYDTPKTSILHFYSKSHDSELPI